MTIPASTKWLICPKPNPHAQARVFCFPYAGGGAMAYRSWAAHLPADVELCAVQLPGRETRFREPLINDPRTLIAQIADQLAPWFDRPCALFGHSMGAIIGFELARELRRRGNDAAKALFVSARVAPQAVVRHEPMYQLPEPAFIARLRQFNGTPEAVFQNPELLEMLLPILRADFAINERYTYVEEAPLAIPITAFGGVADQVVDPNDIQHWACQTTATFSQHLLPGDHFFLTTAQAAITATITRDLRAAMLVPVV